VRLLVDHEGQPLARTKSGTLQLSTDGKGLAVRATLDPSDPDVQRLLPKMRRGDLDQMSFAFRVPTDGDAWDYSGDMPSRTIRGENLSGGDVSVVTYPANENASVQVRSLERREAAYTLADALLREMRAGNSVDMTQLGKVLQALAAADDHLDAAEAMVASILGVTNPDVAQDQQNSQVLSIDLAKRQSEALALRAQRA
jgi:hypothetical protein